MSNIVLSPTSHPALEVTEGTLEKSGREIITVNLWQYGNIPYEVYMLEGIRNHNYMLELHFYS